MKRVFVTMEPNTRGAFKAGVLFTASRWHFCALVASSLGEPQVVAPPAVVGHPL